MKGQKGEDERAAVCENARPETRGPVGGRACEQRTCALGVSYLSSKLVRDDGEPGVLARTSEGQVSRGAVMSECLLSLLFGRLLKVRLGRGGAAHGRMARVLG